MKKSIVILNILILLLISLCSCLDDTVSLESGNVNSSTVNREELTVESVKVGERLCDQMGFPDQNNPPPYNWVNASDTDDVEIEYDKISVTLAKNSYSLNSLISIYVENLNEKPYSLFCIPYIEKWDTEKNEWIRLIYAPDEAYHSSWYTCVDSTVITFNPYFASELLEPGQYRFLVFSGGKTFYSPEFMFLN